MDEGLGMGIPHTSVHEMFIKKREISPVWYFVLIQDRRETIPR
jgi:hypothetical protein